MGLTSVAAFVGILLCAYVGFRAYGFRRERLEEEAERVEETVMPGARIPEGF